MSAVDRAADHLRRSGPTSRTSCRWSTRSAASTSTCRPSSIDEFSGAQLPRRAQPPQRRPGARLLARPLLASARRHRPHPEPGPAHPLGAADRAAPSPQSAGETVRLVATAGRHVKLDGVGIARPVRTRPALAHRRSGQREERGAPGRCRRREQPREDRRRRVAARRLRRRRGAAEPLMHGRPADRRTPATR